MMRKEIENKTKNYHYARVSITVFNSAPLRKNIGWARRDTKKHHKDDQSFGTASKQGTTNALWFLNLKKKR